MSHQALGVKLLIGVVTSLVVLISSSAVAQSMNIDFGSLTGQPASSFAGAGEAGEWNSIAGTQGTTYTSLVALDGSATTASLYNVGGSTLDSTSGFDPSAAPLLGDYLLTFTPTLETCIFMNGLENGTYRVITYAHVASSPSIPNFVTVDQSSEPGAIVSGAWTGAFVESVTHAEHVAEITTGALALHSGIPSGSSPFVAAMNGIQLVLLPDFVPFLRGDANRDGTVDIGDGVTVLDYLFGPTDLSQCLVSADANDDGSVDIADAVTILDLLFASGDPLPSPYPDCGDDDTADALPDCSAFDSCP